jgi:hypothetical protein
MPNNPSLLVVLASFMLEARADGQGARTQLQLAQKTNPSLIETYSIYACQQLAKKLQPGEGLAFMSLAVWVLLVCCCRLEHNPNLVVPPVRPFVVRAGGDGLDLLSYVEFQRNYMACVRSHRAALTAQKAFWSSLLRDTISFKDLQVCAGRISRAAMVTAKLAGCPSRCATQVHLHTTAHAVAGQRQSNGGG